MKVFIGWSGDESKALAMYLRTWIHDVLQHVQPWVSKADIDGGATWAAELSSELNDTSFGIIILTKGTQEAPWLNFEAGALSKRVTEKTRVVPLLVNMGPADVTTPLSQFQARLFDKDDMHALLHDINKLTESPLSVTDVDKFFSKWWDDLASWYNDFKGKQTNDAPEPPPRPTDEMIEEILLLTRQISRSSSTLPRTVRDLARRLSNAETFINVVPDGVFPTNYVSDDENVRRQQTLTEGLLQKFAPLRERSSVSVDRDCSHINISVSGPLTEIPMSEIIDWGNAEGLEITFDENRG